MHRAALAPSAIVGLAAIGASIALAASAASSPYAARGICAGFPRVDLRTPAGWCVALLADQSAGLRFPRRVLEVAPGRYWLLDMGSWEPGRGRLLEFALPARARDATTSPPSPSSSTSSTGRSASPSGPTARSGSARPGGSPA